MFRPHTYPEHHDVPLIRPHPLPVLPHHHTNVCDSTSLVLHTRTSPSLSPLTLSRTHELTYTLVLIWRESQRTNPLRQCEGIQLCVSERVCVSVCAEESETASVSAISHTVETSPHLSPPPNSGTPCPTTG